MKLVIISDTHCKHREVKFPPLLEEDRFNKPILVHCGDFSYRGTQAEVLNFLDWIAEIEDQFSSVIILEGNHDADFCYGQKNLYLAEMKGRTKKAISLWAETYEKRKTISVGPKNLKFFGFPFVPFFTDVNEFFLQRGTHDLLVNNILPCDVLISHGPPFGIMDLGGRRLEKLGSLALEKKILEIKPKLVAFGHIHEGFKEEPMLINDILYVNAAQCNYPEYDLTGKPVVVEL